MDLFSVVHLSKPKQVTEGVRPLRDGEEPLLESTAGRTMELVLEQPEVESTDVLAPTPLRSVPSVTVDPPRPDATSIGSSEDADVAEVDSGLKRKRATGWKAAAPSKSVEDTSIHDNVMVIVVLSIGCSVSKLTSDSSRRDCMLHSPLPQTVPKALRSWQCAASRVYQRSCPRTLTEEKMAHLLVKVDKSARMLRSTRQVCHWAVAHQPWFSALLPLSALEVARRSGSPFGDVVKCDHARGKAKRWKLDNEKNSDIPAAHHELPHITQLERDQDYPIDVIMAGLTLARHATEGAEAQPDYFLKPDVAQLQSRKESLEAQTAIRLAKKKGVKGKAILCGVGAAHIPRSDGVPVSVATVLPKDSELLGKLEEAGDAAYQVGRSEQSRCHSI
ncbi:hypothetical protein Tco_0357115 [Tanacetum coccineum]